MEKKRSKKWLKPTLLFGILTIVFTWSYLNYINKKKNLAKNYKISKANLSNVKMPGRSAGYWIFNYFVAGKQYSGSYSSVGSINNLRQFYNLVNYEWQMIYDSTDYENSTLLLQMADYIKFNIPYNGQRIVDFENMVIKDSSGVVKELKGDTQAVQ